MEWTVVAALVLRPLGNLTIWGGAAAIAWAISPLFPPKWRAVLYDRTLRKRHFWKFAIGGMTACYGTFALIYWLI